MLVELGVCSNGIQRRQLVGWDGPEKGYQRYRPLAGDGWKCGVNDVGVGVGVVDETRV